MAGTTEKCTDRIPKEVAEQIDYLGDRERDYDRDVKTLCVGKLVSHWLDMQEDLAVLEAKADYVRDRITYLRETILTAYMDILGVDSFEFEGTRREKDSLIEQPYIGSVAIRENVHARIVESRQDEAADWLLARNYGSNFQFVRMISINAQTLKSIMRKAIRNGEDPVKLKRLFGLHVTREAAMKVKFKEVEEGKPEGKEPEGKEELKGGDPA